MKLTATLAASLLNGRGPIAKQVADLFRGDRFRMETMGGFAIEDVCGLLAEGAEEAPADHDLIRYVFDDDSALLVSSTKGFGWDYPAGDEGATRFEFGADRVPEERR